MENKKNIKQVAQEKERKTMETVARKASYYRANPQRFVAECLGVTLKLFQKILIYAMMHYNYFMFIATRGIGKTWLTALFSVVRCILYPGTKIVVVSGTLKQANNVLLKIQDDLMRQSEFLRNEIEKCNIGQNDAIIMFKNGSWITTCTSTDTARGLRANIIIVDEFRMVVLDILNKVIRKFLTSPRQPKYLNRPEYAHMQERNKEIYMSSAYFRSSWAYKKLQAYVANFFDDTKKYFVCGLPYQLSIKENLLSKDQIRDEMSEADFNELAFYMEMETLWFGDDGQNFFKYDDINRRRTIKNAYMPLKFYTNSNPVPKLADTEERILSVDVALMASSRRVRNDASSITINSAIQIDNTTFKSNFVYFQNFEGLTTDALGIIVMRYFNHYKCTQLVLDTNGVGLGVYDFICKDQYDPETGETYKAMTSCNNQEMAERCKVKDALKVVWCVKADATFNSNVCISLRTGLQNGKVSLLISEQDAEEVLRKNNKAYSKMSVNDQTELKMPYVQTTMAEFELIKLDSEVRDGRIKVKEVAGMRKDRYSSMAYSYWCATQLELALKPNNSSTEDLVRKLTKQIRKSSLLTH